MDCDWVYYKGMKAMAHTDIFSCKIRSHDRILIILKLGVLQVL